MKKKTKIIIGVVAGIVVLGLLGQSGNTTKKETPAATVTEKSDNILLSKKLKTANVLNGSGDTVIGERAYIEIKKADMEALTNEQFTEFAQEVVKDSGYNYVTIIAMDASKGIFFPGSDINIIQYGKVNVDGTLNDVYGYITLQEDGTYIYNEK